MFPHNGNHIGGVVVSEATAVSRLQLITSA